jgi:hypothetical protein
MDYNYIRGMLKSGPCNVTFTKVDGTERYMRCTLSDSLLPEQYKGKGDMITEGSNTIRVFDLGINEWRSFRVDSVTNISYDNGVSLNNRTLLSE